MDLSGGLVLASGADTESLSPRVKLEWLPESPGSPEFPQHAEERGYQGSVLIGAFNRCSTCTASRKPKNSEKLDKDEDCQGEQQCFEGSFERRGLRRWDVFWNSSFAELRGRVLTVYDVDSFEGDRTLLVHVVLSEDFEVVRMTDTEWQLRSSEGRRARNSDLHFQWRVPDAGIADQWINYLQEACLPEKLPTPEDGATKLATEGDDVFVDTVILKSLLSPALLGWALFDPSAMKVVVKLWSEIADIINGAAIMPDTEEQKEAKETLEHAERPFQVSRRQFEACFLNETDLELNVLVEACEGFTGVLALMGSWTVPLAREGYKNSSLVKSRLGGEPVASARSMLQAEVAQGIHQPGGLIADPSLAMGVVWMYRGLSLWTEMCRRCAIPSSWPEGPPSNLLKGSFDHAYDVVIKPFHGVIMQSGVAVGTNFLPQWDDISQKFAPTSEAVQEDIGKWVAVMDMVLPRMKTMIHEFDLNDTRRTF